MCNFEGKGKNLFDFSGCYGEVALEYYANVRVQNKLQHWTACNSYKFITVCKNNNVTPLIRTCFIQEPQAPSTQNRSRQ